MKCDAFSIALKDYPREAVDAFLDYHKSNGGYSRFEKFRYFFKEFHPVEDVESKVDLALRRFATAVFESYTAMSPITEAITTIKALRLQSIKLWVCSGSKQDELQKVFRYHHLDEHFEAVLGSPTSKVEHLNSIIEHTGIQSHELRFVGDGRADYDASLKLQIPFFYLGEYSEWAPETPIQDYQGKSFKRWPDLREELLKL